MGLDLMSERELNQIEVLIPVVQDRVTAVGAANVPGPYQNGNKISFLKPSEAQAKAAEVDLENLQKRTRVLAETMGRVPDALGRLHEERATDYSPGARACDLDVTEASLPGDERKHDARHGSSVHGRTCRIRRPEGNRHRQHH